MYNVTLVCTHHSELGKSNCYELYRILESIRPNVIFEELNPYLFNRFYQRNDIPVEPPEVKTVKRYLKDHATSHYPVDIDPSNMLSDDEFSYLFNTLKRYSAYSALEIEQQRLISQEGFNFLNSKKCEELFEKKKFLERNLVAFHSNKNQLVRLLEVFYKELDARETEIVKNIYRYSGMLDYKQAILLLGSGHRKTFFEKVLDFDSRSEIKLNWALYGD